MMSFLEIVAIVIVLAAAVTGFALIRGENRWNRLLGYNIVSGKVAILIVVWAAITNNYFYLDIAIVYVLLSFIGVTALSDYLVDTGRKVDLPLEPEAVAHAAQKRNATQFSATQLGATQLEVVADELAD